MNKPTAINVMDLTTNLQTYPGLTMVYIKVPTTGDLVPVVSVEIDTECGDTFGVHGKVILASE